MATGTNVLTEAQRAALDRALVDLDMAKELIRKAQACEMDCADWAVVRDTLERKIRLVRQHFGQVQ